MKCPICGKITNKLYPCRFTDDPEDNYGYTENVCVDCIPEGQEDIYDEYNYEVKKNE